MVKDIEQLDLNKTYTYTDYLTWQFKERVELIKGKVFKMSPAPSRLHQQVSMNLSGLFWSALRNKPCQVFHAPFDVRLPLDKKGECIITVVQPDLCIICDVNILDDKGCLGAPDLIIEILSPGNSKKELKDKYSLYERNGVLQYWVVIPSQMMIQVFTLENGQFIPHQPLSDDDVLRIDFLGNLEIEVKDVFV